MNKFINLKLDNIVNEHICCIIRSKSKHEGIDSKKKWLKERKRKRQRIKISNVPCGTLHQCKCERIIQWLKKVKWTGALTACFLIIL